MKLRKRDHVGGIYLLPHEARWIVATREGENVRPYDGDTLPLEGDFPPPPALVTELMDKARAVWNLVIPISHRSGLTTLPPLKDVEIAQGARWEAHKILRIGEEDAVVDFERLKVPGQAEGQGTTDTLLVALTRKAIDAWLVWLRELPKPPQRLEPAFPACLRAIQWAVCHSKTYDAPVVYLHGDEAGAGIAVLCPRRVYALRRVPERDSLRNRWTGEDGIRVLRETLLYAEDRYPRLEIGGLVGIGDIDRTWLDEASKAAHLPVLSPPTPPAGVSSSLGGDGRWCVPYGALLGAER